MYYCYPGFLKRQKYPKSVVAVSTSPANDAKGDKSKVEVKRELKSFFVIFSISLIKRKIDVYLTLNKYYYAVTQDTINQVIFFLS